MSMNPAMQRDKGRGTIHTAVLVVLAAAVMAALPAHADERANAGDWPQSALRSPAMSAMLRADQDKDGVLSREELADYDLTLVPRFAEFDWDLSGKLSLYELEFLLGASQAPSIGATR
jgi:hypothetical protein